MILKSLDQNIQLDSNSWSFAIEGLAPHFSSHIKKSLPCYNEGHDLILDLSSYFVSPSSLIYDLGCSVGELTKKLAERFQKDNKTRIIGIDKEPEMISFAQKSSQELKQLSFLCKDFLTIDFKQTDLAIFYYTLQFLKLEERSQILSQIANVLTQNGACIVFEKVIENSAWLEGTIDYLHRKYKLSRGFSSEEILAKEASLKGILTPLSQTENFELFKKSGFSKVDLVMKNLHFEGYVLRK